MKKIIVLFYNFLWGNEPIFPDSLPPEGFEFTFDHDRLQEANAVVFHLPNLFQSMDEEEINKPDGQIWIAWNLESEINYPRVESEEIRSLFDLRMGYHQNDDILYSYYSFLNESDFKYSNQELPVLNKACMFISSSVNKSHRLEYLNELMRYTEIDSYGRMFHNKNIEYDNGESTLKEIAQKYKFVIAFENAISKDYVTEKFFNPLVIGSVPVYLGAPNIEDFIPGKNSFVDVRNFDSPKDLADFLNRCYLDNDLYNQFHQWKKGSLLPSFLDKLNTAKEHPIKKMCTLIKNTLSNMHG